MPSYIKKGAQPVQNYLGPFKVPQDPTGTNLQVIGRNNV